LADDSQIYPRIELIPFVSQMATRATLAVNDAACLLLVFRDREWPLVFAEVCVELF
jgi:hypothetical protein